MSADVKAENQPYDDINITPMLDLAYVLLVTFIILTTASVQGVRVNSPETRTISNLARPQTRAVTLTADGAMYFSYEVGPVHVISVSSFYPTEANPDFSDNSPITVWTKADLASIDRSRTPWVIVSLHAP
jgi:biopolymer transport protein ExbD